MIILLRGRTALFLVALALVFSGLLPSTSEALSGGPDAFGYHYIDSNSVGGPQYDWEDIDKTGTNYKGFDNYYTITTPNSISIPIDIGFDFDFYGRTYSAVYLAGNGYIVFKPKRYRNYVYDGSRVPAKSEPNNIIAPFWGWNDSFS